MGDTQVSIPVMLTRSQAAKLAHLAAQKADQLDRQTDQQGAGSTEYTRSEALRWWDMNRVLLDALIGDEVASR